MDYFSSNQTSVVLGDLAEEPPSPLDSPLEVVELQEAGRAGEKEEQPQQESAPERQDMDKRDSSSTPPAIASVVREERLPPPANPRAWLRFSSLSRADAVPKHRLPTRRTTLVRPLCSIRHHSRHLRHSDRHRLELESLHRRGGASPARRLAGAGELESFWRGQRTVG